MWILQRQRTAGAYLLVEKFTSRKKAVAALAEIAAQTPNFPYNGEDKWQDSDSSHHVNRYRIIKL